MESRALWIAFFITIQFSAVLGKNPFYEYFYNKYHHKDHHSSTTEEISSVSGDFEIIEHLSAGHSENIIQSSTGEFELTKYSFQDNDDTSMTPPTLQYGDYYYDRYRDTQNAAIIITAITLGSFVLLALCGCCIFLCVRQCRRNPEVRGRVIILNRPETATEVRPGQPVLVQHPVTAQHQQQPQVVQQYWQPVTNQQQYPHGYVQHPPPRYESHPVPQQYPLTQLSQNSPAQSQSHNPPNAPAEFPEKFE